MKKVLVSIMWIVIGGTLFGLAYARKVDGFWYGMGSGLVVVGAIQLLRFWRLKKDEAYREKMEIEESDERNHFIRGKAWAWTGYLFILIAGASSIIFKIVDQDLLSFVASYAVCLMLVLFWVSYSILKRKY